MKTVLLTVVSLALTAAPTFATWSVVAVDRQTRQVVIASATCVPQRSFANFPATGLMDIQAIVVPGVGVAAAQAGVDRTRKNQALIFTELQKGTAPARIIELLKTDPGIESRQFGIVDLQGRSAGFSGRKNNPTSLDRQDRVAGTGIVVSIQGNILAGEAVVLDALEAFKSGRGSLADRVMAAMEVADARGGDTRCTCESEPRPTLACTTRTAHVAYILRADPGDRSGTSFNDGQYAMYVSVTDADIAAAEDANPVKTLRLRYEAWKKGHPGPL
jgi:uncharacterized Ntn-hydrolase superfamily protein